MSQDGVPALEIRESDGTTFVKVVASQIQPETRDPLYATADRLAGTPGPKNVVLNLGNVRHFNSAMIGVLINFQRKVREAGGRLAVCCVDPQVYEMFKLTRMDSIFQVLPNERASLDAFRRKPGASGAAGRSWLSRIFGR